MLISKGNLDHLASAILNMELGMKKYNEKLEVLPNPHAKWPIVTIPPRTDAGKPIGIHYQPCFGIIYFIGDCNTSQLIFKLNEKLNALSPNIEKDTVINFSNNSANIYMRQFLNRSFNLHNSKTNIPSILSSNTFVWLLMDIVDSPIDKPIGLNNINMLCGSILFDERNISKYNNNDEVYKISIDDFKINYKPLPQLFACGNSKETICILNNKINIYKLTKHQLAATIPLLYRVSNLPVATVYNKHVYCYECLATLYGTYVYINSTKSSYSLCNNCYIIEYSHRRTEGEPMRIETATTQYDVSFKSSVEQAILCCTVTDIGDKFCIIESPNGDKIVLADSSYGKYPHFRAPFDSLSLPIISQFGVIIF